MAGAIKGWNEISTFKALRSKTKTVLLRHVHILFGQMGQGCGASPIAFVIKIGRAVSELYAFE